MINPRLTGRSNRLFDELENYYWGNHFKYWVGSKPDMKDIEMWEEIKRIFISNNLIGECVDRQINGLLSKEPMLLVNNAESPRLDNWMEFVNSHYQMSRNVIDEHIFETVARHLLVRGVAFMRLYTPERFNYGSPDPSQRIFIHSPHPNNVKFDYDDDDLLKSIDYITEDFVETQRQTEDGQLNIATYSRNAGLDSEPIEEYNLNLNGGWTIYMIQAPSLITDSVKRIQNGINLSITMMNRNTVQAGFLERLLLNAQSPGQMVEDENGDSKFIPDENGFKTGASAVNYVQGLPNSGNLEEPEGFTTPQVEWRDPVDVSTFIDSINAKKAMLYGQFSQGHVLVNESSNMSGISREQSRQEFVQKTNGLAKKLQRGLSQIVSSAYKILGGNINDKVAVELNPSTTLLTPEEHKALQADFQAGILSHHTTLIRLGVDDPEEEIKKLEGERDRDLQVQEQDETQQNSA